MATRREFIELLMGATVAGVVAANVPNWNFVVPAAPVDAETLLKSKGIEFLEIAGQRVFPLYAMSGGLHSDQMFYLYRRYHERLMVLGVRVGMENIHNDPATHAREAVLFGIREFEEHAQKVDPLGDDMGIGLKYEERL